MNEGNKATEFENAGNEGGDGIKSAEHPLPSDGSSGPGSGGENKPKRRRRRYSRWKTGARRTASQAAPETGVAEAPGSVAEPESAEHAEHAGHDEQAPLGEESAVDSAAQPATSTGENVPKAVPGKSRRRRRRRGPKPAVQVAAPAGSAAELVTPLVAPAEPEIEVTLEEEAEEEHQAAPVEVAERSDLDLRSQVKRTQTAQKLLKFPGLDTGKARKVLLQFLRDEMERRGAQKIVVGVSGGMNSAVSAGLAVEALGRDHVTLIHLVEQDKGSQARSHADLVARCLQSPLEIMDQRSHLNMLPRHHDALLPHQKNRLRRERAAALYEVCEAHPGQVLLGSLDKTQWLLGFGVEGGNLEYAFNPLGDLYHHQVRELARAMGVPREILDQDTKAELSNEIAADAKPGWTWEEMDYYLYQMVDAKIALSYLLFLGLDEEKLRWVYRRLRDTAHQRKMAPVADALSAYVQRSGLPRS